METEKLSIDNETMNAFLSLRIGLFSSLSELETLDLSGNRLSALPSGAFRGAAGLQVREIACRRCTQYVYMEEEAV